MGEIIKNSTKASNIYRGFIIHTLTQKNISSVLNILGLENPKWKLKIYSYDMNPPQWLIIFLAKPEIQKNFYDIKEDQGKIEICA